MRNITLLSALCLVLAIQLSNTFVRTKMSVLGPSCTKATDQDANNLNFDKYYNDACHQVCNGNFDAWHFNPDQDHEVCLVQGETRFYGMSPKTGSKQVSSQEFTNDLDKPTSQTINLSGSDGNSLSYSTTNSLSLSESIAIEVEIPEVMKVTSTTTFSVSTSTTTSNTKTEERSYSNSVSVDVQPGETVCAVLEVNTVSYDSQFEVDVCFDGYMRCQYADRCNGHYYWYTWLGQYDRSQRCGTIAGRASTNSESNAHARAYKGACQPNMRLHAEEIKPNN